MSLQDYIALSEVLGSIRDAFHHKEYLDWFKSMNEQLLMSCPWKECTDVYSHKIYFYNIVTRESVWKMPEELATLWEMRALFDALEKTFANRQRSWAQINARLRQLEEENRTVKELLNNLKEKHKKEIADFKSKAEKEKQKHFDEKFKLENELKRMRKMLEDAEAQLDLKKSCNNDDKIGASTNSPDSPSDGKEYTAEEEEAVEKVRKCQDFYEILGVTPDTPESDLKKAYRKRSLQLHPDKNRAPGATEAFKALQRAFDVLSDPVKKRDYDTYLYMGSQFQNMSF